MLPSQPWRAVRLCATGSIASLHAFHVAFYQRQSAWRLPLGFIYRSAWTPVELASLARLRWTLVAFALHPSTTKPWHRSALRVAAVPGEETSRRVGSVLGIAQSPPPPSLSLALLLLDFRRLPIFLILLSVGFEFDGTDDNEESGFVTRQSRPLV
jgi:hypothetical protein